LDWPPQLNRMQSPEIGELFAANNEIASQPTQPQGATIGKHHCAQGLVRTKLAHQLSRIDRLPYETHVDRL
jgi:hypothetical protein